MQTEELTTESNYRIEVEQLLGMNPYVKVSDLVREDYIGIYLTAEECLTWADKLVKAAASAGLRRPDKAVVVTPDDEQFKWIASYTSFVRTCIQSGETPDTLEVFIQKMTENKTGEE